MSFFPDNEKIRGLESRIESLSQALNKHRENSSQHHIDLWKKISTINERLDAVETTINSFFAGYSAGEKGAPEEFVKEHPTKSTEACHLKCQLLSLINDLEEIVEKIK